MSAPPTGQFWIGVNSLEPYTWLRQVLNELPAAKTVDDVDALMPWHIKNKIMTQS